MNNCILFLSFLFISTTLSPILCKEEPAGEKQNDLVGSLIIGGILGSVLGPDGLVNGGGDNGDGAGDGGFFSNLFGGPQTTEDFWAGWSTVTQQPSTTRRSKNISSEKTTSTTTGAPKGRNRKGGIPSDEGGWSHWSRLPIRSEDSRRDRNVTELHGFYISTSNSDLLDGIGSGDGDRTEESCLAKAEFRNGSAEAIENIPPMRIKRELQFCDRMVLLWIVDTEEDGVSWKDDQSGCVYRPPDIGDKRLWSQSLTKSSARPFGENDRKDFDAISRRRIKQAPCGSSKYVQANLFDVTIAKARCQMLRKIVTQNRCNACELRAVLDEDGRFHRCVLYKLKATRSIRFYEGFVKDCVDDIAEEDVDLDC